MIYQFECPGDGEVIEIEFPITAVPQNVRCSTCGAELKRIFNTINGTLNSYYRTTYLALVFVDQSKTPSSILRKPTNLVRLALLANSVVLGSHLFSHLGSGVVVKLKP